MPDALEFLLHLFRVVVRITLFGEILKESAAALMRLMIGQPVPYDDPCVQNYLRLEDPPYTQGESS